MNQGKLEVVKQEMARVNIIILGISELNGLESLRRSGVAIMVNKSAKYSTWMQSQK